MYIYKTGLSTYTYVHVCMYVCLSFVALVFLSKPSYLESANSTLNRVIFS